MGMAQARKRFPVRLGSNSVDDLADGAIRVQGYRIENRLVPLVREPKTNNVPLLPEPFPSNLRSSDRSIPRFEADWDRFPLSVGCLETRLLRKRTIATTK